MPTFQTPQLIITDAGLAAAQVATPVGPFIHIDRFQIGDGYGYTPTRADTGLNGNLLFEDAPLSYRYVGDNTLDIICRLPADAGPFQFGEVALWLADAGSGSKMFAKAAFQDLQIKYSSLGTNVLSTYTFNCLLKLDQAVAVFKINTNCLPPDIWVVDKWSDVYPPALSANPEIPSILVLEPDTFGNASLITQASDTHWSMSGNYRQVNEGTVVGATVNYIDFNAASLKNINNGLLLNEYVIETADGYLRACTSEVNMGANIRFNLTEPLPAVPPVGSVVSINSMLTNQTLLEITGSASGSAIIKGDHVTLSLAITPGAALARQQAWDVAGTYSFIVPDDVHFLYLRGGGAGAGGGGAGGGDPTGPFPYSTDTQYHGGGGGGGGGAGDTVPLQVIPVTPGETVTVIIGAKGLGGAGGAPGHDGVDGTPGGDTVISGSFGTITIPGGSAGGHGAGYGLPSGTTGAGGVPGVPGGAYGIDGLVGAAGGVGGTSEFGAGGAGGRGATLNPGGGATGAPGTGNSSGGGGGGGLYVQTNTDPGGHGGDGTDGYAQFSW